MKATFEVNDETLKLIYAITRRVYLTLVVLVLLIKLVVVVISLFSG